MKLADDKQFRDRQHLSSAIATCDLALRTGNLPPFGWKIMVHIKRHLLQEYRYV